MAPNPGFSPKQKAIRRERREAEARLHELIDAYNSASPEMRRAFGAWVKRFNEV